MADGAGNSEADGDEADEDRDEDEGDGEDAAAGPLAPPEDDEGTLAAEAGDGPAVLEPARPAQDLGQAMARIRSRSSTDAPFTPLVVANGSQ